MATHSQGSGAELQPLQVELSDAVNQALVTYAGRIASLLDDPRVEKDPNRAALLDDFLGAVYALMFAHGLGFEDRPKKSIELPVVRRRARQAERGQLRLDGKWMAGFHFNNAIFRLAAVQHRLLQLVAPSSRREENRVPELRKRASEYYRKWTGSHWVHKTLDIVHGQVNDLKHDPKGVYPSRKVRYQHALAGVGELLDLMEVWSAQVATADGA